MAVMDAQALTTDPEVIALLADVLGLPAVDSAQDRRFPREAWMPVLRVEERFALDLVHKRPKRRRVPVHAA